MTNICNIIVSNFIAVIVVLWVVFSICYPGQIPTFTFTAITAGFAYQAYKYTKEKFRLELYEKRMVLYEALHEELETISTGSKEYPKSTGSVNRNKFSFLFGKEIDEFIGKVDFTLIEQNYTDISCEDTHKRVMLNQFDQTVHFMQLKDKFSPYLYFGDYKSNMQQEKNLCELCVLCGEKFKNLLSFKSQKGQI